MSSAVFDRAVDAHGSSVRRVCRSILRDDHLVDDAAQETFLRLWRRVASGRAPERFGAWLRRVAVTVSVDFARRRARTAAEPVDDVAASANDPAHAELVRRFERAVARLPERQRVVFSLRHSGGLTLAEVADTLDIAVPTAKTQFARACLKLQAALSAFDPSRTEEA